MDSLWRSRDLQLVGGARAVSVFGDEVALVALLMHTHDFGLGPFAVTGLLVAFAVPTVAMAGLAGRLVDRYDSRVLCVASSLWQAVACLALAVAPQQGWFGAGVTYALVVVLQVGNAVALPTWQALVPEIVGDDRLGKAMGDLQALATAAGVAGPAVGGMLVAGPGFTWAMVVNSLTFGLLALAGLAVGVRRLPQAHEASPSDDGAGRRAGGLALSAGHAAPARPGHAGGVPGHRGGHRPARACPRQPRSRRGGRCAGRGPARGSAAAR